MSTHFEGEPPTNADNFNNWFVKPAKGQDPVDLPALKYIVYGLGDTSYTYFGQFAKNVDKCLEKKNSIRIKDLVIGSNHTNNIADHFLEWKEGFWPSILDHVPLRAEGEPVSEDEDDSDLENENLPSYKFIAEFLEPGQVTNERVGDWKDYEIGAQKLLGALDGKIVEMRDLRQKNSDTGRTLHIELELPQGVTYETASNLVVYPENSEEAIRTVCDKILGLDHTQKFSLSTNKRFAKNRNIKKPFPSPITVGDYLRKYIDLQGVLKKTTLKALAELLTKESHPTAKKYLEDLILPKNRLKYNALIKNKYGILDLLLEQNITLKLEELIEVGSQIQPRYYTIASSSLVNPQRVAMCLSMTIDTLPSSKIRPGLVSGMMLDIFRDFKRQKNYQKSLKINFQKSNFVKPSQNETSCILISTGAGFAPFKAFIDEKKSEKGAANQGVSKYGKLFVFFGCRNRDEDYIYKDDMFDANSNGTITALHEAFSREEERKYYVQDILMFKGALINDV
jgi:NADPH-ferrihemoprotein reductase